MSKGETMTIAENDQRIATIQERIIEEISSGNNESYEVVTGLSRELKITNQVIYYALQGIEGLIESKSGKLDLPASEPGRTTTPLLEGR